MNLRTLNSYKKGSKSMTENELTNSEQFSKRPGVRSDRKAYVIEFTDREQYNIFLMLAGWSWHHKNLSILAITLEATEDDQEKATVFYE